MGFIHCSLLCHKQRLIDPQILVSMDAEDDLLDPAVLQGFLHGRHGDTGGLALGETEHARGDAAEGHAFEPLFLRQHEAGAVAGGEQLPVAVGQWPVDDRADGVQHMPGREIVAPGELGLSGRLLVALGTHDRGTFLTQLQAGGGVDHVVDAVVPRPEAAQKPGVGRVHDGVRVQPRDVALPEDEALVRGDGRELRHMDDALFRSLPTQQLILRLQKALGQCAGLSDVHQTAQETALLLRIPRDALCLPAVLGHLVQQRFIQKLYLL